MDDNQADLLLGSEMQILDKVEKASVLLHMFLPLKLKLYLFLNINMYSTCTINAIISCTFFMFEKWKKKKSTLRPENAVS